MTDSMVPEDIRKKAETLCCFLEAMPSDGNVSAIAQALLDERERCAKIAAAHYNITHSHQARFAGANIASAIRSQASPSKPAQGTR